MDDFDPFEAPSNAEATPAAEPAAAAAVDIEDEVTGDDLDEGDSGETAAAPAAAASSSDDGAVASSEPARVPSPAEEPVPFEPSVFVPESDALL